MLVYFSNVSENTHRFVNRMALRAYRIPLKGDLIVTEPYVLITPTYGNHGEVPKQTANFLNDLNNRNLLCGVIGSGNQNFGVNFAMAAEIISKKCQIPLLYKFELSGTPIDEINIRNGLKQFETRRLLFS